MATKILSSLVDENGLRDSITIDALINQSIIDSKDVSKFPVESGFNVSDHAFTRNKKINLTGVISAATLRDGDDDVIITGFDTVTIEEALETDRSTLKVLGNELANKVPDNIFTRNKLTQKKVTVEDIESPATLSTKIATVETARKFLQSHFDKATFVTLDTEEEDIDDLIIVNLTFDKKKPEKNVLNFSMSLEQIRVVNNQRTFIQKNIKPSDEKAAAEDSDTGSNNTKKTNLDSVSGEGGFALEGIKALAGLGRGG